MVFPNHRPSLTDHKEDLNNHPDVHLHLEQVHQGDHLLQLTNHLSKLQSLNNLVTYHPFTTNNKVLLNIHRLGLYRLGEDPMDPHPLKVTDLLDPHPLKAVDLVDLHHPLKLVDLLGPHHLRP